MSLVKKFNIQPNQDIPLNILKVFESINSLFSNFSSVFSKASPCSDNFIIIFCPISFVSETILLISFNSFFKFPSFVILLNLSI